MLYTTWLLAFQMAFSSFNLFQANDLSVTLMDKYCSWCGATNPDSATSCKRCGRPV